MACARALPVLSFSSGEIRNALTQLSTLQLASHYLASARYAKQSAPITFAANGDCPFAVGSALRALAHPTLAANCIIGPVTALFARGDGR
jgi:hypothetical protein